MMILKNEIKEKAARIIAGLGLKKLTIQSLAIELRISEEDLYNQLSGIDDVILLLLNDFNKDFAVVIDELQPYSENSGLQFKFFFNKMYSLFLQKPYYLELIFDDSLSERGERIRISILNFKSAASKFLSSLIDKGKIDNTFKTKESTKDLANKILYDFKLIMQDQQLYFNIMRDLKTIKS